MILPNIVPILGVTILNIILGMLWYSPLLLGTLWAKSHKFNMRELKPSPLHYAGSVLVSLITASVLAILITQFQITTWKGGMVFGLYLWLGLIVTTHFSGVIWAQKPLRVYFIDTTYLLISIVMMSTLLALWRI